MNAIEEVFQYISTSTVVELQVNKKYEAMVKSWEEVQRIKGINIKLTLTDIPETQAIVVGKNVYAKVDFEEIVSSLIGRFFV